jgi:hypothetical protein
MTDRGCDTENKGTTLQSVMCGINKYRQKYVNTFRFVRPMHVNKIQLCKDNVGLAM